MLIKNDLPCSILCLATAQLFLHYHTEQDLPWHNVWSADNPVEVLNEHLFLLVGRFVPTKIICVLNKDSLGLMINAGTLLASSRKLIFGGPVIALGLTGKSLSTVK